MSDPVISEDLKALAEAYSLNNQASNRAWAFLAVLTLVATSGALTNTGAPLEILGATLNTDYFFWVCLPILSLGNTAYVSAHLQAYHTGDIYRDYLDSTAAKTKHIVSGMTKGVTLENVAHCLYTPNLNRLYPINHAASGSILTKWAIAYGKFLFDFIYFLVPVSGIVLCLGTVALRVFASPTEIGGAMLVFLGLFALASIGATGLLIKRAFAWDLAGLRRLSS